MPGLPVHQEKRETIAISSTSKKGLVDKGVPPAFGFSRRGFPVYEF